MHGAVPDMPAKLAQRGWMVVACDVVQGVLVGFAVIGEAVAHAEIKRPDVGESVVQQVADQIAVLGHHEQVAGGCQAVNDEDDVVAFGAAEPRQAKSQAVVGRERMHRHLSARHPVKRVSRDTVRHLSSSGCTATSVYSAGSSATAH